MRRSFRPAVLAAVLLTPAAAFAAGPFSAPQYIETDSVPISMVSTEQKPDGSVRFLDLDRNGEGDVVLLNGGSITVALNFPNAALARVDTYTTISDAHRAVAADFNQDGKTDLAVARSADRIALLRNDGTGRFGAPQDLGGLSAQEPLTHITALDLDNSGKMSIAVRTGTIGVATYYNRNSAFTKQAWQIFFTNPTAGFIPFRAVLNGTARTHLLITNMIDPIFVLDSFTVIRNSTPTGSLTARLTTTPQDAYAIGGSVETVAKGDWNRDGFTDIVAAANTERVLVRFEGNGSAPTFALKSASPLPGTGGTVALTAGSFDNALGSDAAAGLSDGTVAVYLTGSTGAFKAPIVTPVSGAVSAIDVSGGSTSKCAHLVGTTATRPGLFWLKNTHIACLKSATLPQTDPSGIDTRGTAVTQ